MVKLCTLIHPSGGVVFLNCILPRAMYSKEDHHHLTCTTYKHAVYMRCHYKNNCNYRFSNLFQAHPFEKLCIQVHPFEEPCTTSTCFHHLTCITYEHAVHMRCHHKNLIIYFEIYFMPGYISNYQMINNIDSQIQNLNSQFCFPRKIGFCNHEIVLILFGFCKWGVLIPSLRMLRKT